MSLCRLSRGSVEVLVGMFAAAAVSGCATAKRFECTAHGGAPVYRVETEHFEVTGQFPRDTLRLEATRLERLYDVYTTFFGHESKQSSARLPVLMLPWGTLEEFMPYAGYVSFDDDVVLVTSVHSSGGSATAHELVHLLSHYWLPRQPRWIAEGLAEYLGDARFVSHDTVAFGGWQQHAGAIVPMDELWSWSEGRRRGDAEAQMYGSAWAWVHYFADRHEKRLAALWRALREQTDPRAAFESVFPAGEWPALHAEVRAYTASARSKGWRSQSLRAPHVSAIETVPDWEVHMLRSRLFSDDNDGPAARGELQEARRLAPEPLPPAAAIALTTRTLLGPERTDALEPYREHPEGLLAWAQGEDLAPAVRLEALARVMRQRPDSVPALLAFARLAAKWDDARALEAASHAAALAPWSIEARWLTATALVKAGQCRKAGEALQEAERVASESPTRVRQQVASVRELLAACREAP